MHYLPSACRVIHRRFAQRCRKVVCRPIADERLDPSQEVDLLRREAAEMRASLQVDTSEVNVVGLFAST